MTGRTECRLLGPFEVRVAGAVVPVRGRQRVALATLALFAGRVVSTQALAERIWSDEPPQQVRASLQTLITRLRRLLGADLIETSAHGYRLRLEAADTDLQEFRQLVEAAQRAAEAGDTDGELSLLHEAVRLWYGEPLSDLSSEQLRADAAGIVEEWFRALERRLDIDLAAGRHREILGELRTLVVRFPLREALWERLILALHRAGRRADALAAFREAAGMVRGQLGLDPGRRMSELHQAVLQDQTVVEEPSPAEPADVQAGALTPRQLPSEAAGFVGRAADLATLDALLEEPATAGQPQRVVTAAVDGPAGIGKTTLVVHWAHRVSRRFVGGQLYVNLHGYGTEKPLDPADALDFMLRSLGVPAARIPSDVDARSALLRSELAGRRTLVILDNARDSEQVRPLLPGSGSLALITGRRQLRSLAVREGARRLTLGLLDDDEAAGLLGWVVGPERVAAEPAAVAAIIELSARLPLALRVVAEHAARRPAEPLADIAADLRQQRSRLDALSADDGVSTDLRAVFSWSYQALQPDTARMFRYLGLLPGAGICPMAAAALAGLPVRQATRLLDQLTAVHLVANPGVGQYEFHDLIGEYARERAESEETEADRRLAADRLLQWYLHTAVSARNSLTSYSFVEPLPAPAELVVPTRFSGHDDAMAWFEAEIKTILLVIERAAATGRAHQAILLSLASWDFLWLAGYRHDLLAIYQRAVRLAVELGARRLEGKALSFLAIAHRGLGHRDEAYAAIDRSIGIFAELRVPEHEAFALVRRANVLMTADDLDGAAGDLERALEMSRQDGHLGVAGDAHNHLCIVETRRQRFDMAIDHGKRSVEIFRKLGETVRMTASLDTYAEALELSGRPLEAIAPYREALALTRELGAVPWRAVVLRDLGRALQTLGELAEARQTWQEAYETYRRLDDPTAETIKGLLDDLDKASETS
jgi:DNA-binding SARP family transcriptional activator